MDEFNFKCDQQMSFLWKIEQKTRSKQFVGFFQNKSTNEMFKSQFEAILHISLIWNIFKFCNILTMQNVKLNLIDPPIDMCQFEH